MATTQDLSKEQVRAFIVGCFNDLKATTDCGFVPDPDYRRCYTSHTTPQDVASGSVPVDFRLGEIVSLWDMLERHALLFAEAVSWMTDAKCLCGSSGVAHGFSDSGIRNVILKASAKLKDACIAADMPAALPSIVRLEQSVDPDGPFPAMHPSAVANEIRNIIMRIRDDLQAEHFFHLDQRDVPIYAGVDLFGDKVGKKFPKAVEDISEAGKCLALHRSTACVFHLMRVMETGVKSLGKKLKVSINVETETWYQITEHVDGAIKRLPAKTQAEKRRKVLLATASANLNAVRIAQRNEVMHPKQTYTRDEAHDVFNSTRAFMSQLAMLV